MSFLAMVEAFAEAERQKRKTARDALAETPSLTEAILKDSPRQVVEVPTATVPAIAARQQDISPRAINRPRESQQADQSTETSLQDHDSLSEVKVYIARREEEINQVLPSSVKATGQDIIAGQKSDVPQVPEQDGNAAKKAKLDTPFTQNGGEPRATKTATTSTPTSHDNGTQQKAVVPKAIVPPAVVPKPILPPAPKALLPPVSRAILPPVSAILPPTAVTKDVTPVATVAVKNKVTRDVTKDVPREGAKWIEAVKLAVTASQKGGLSQTIKDNSGTQQNSQVVTTAEQLNNAVQETLFSTAAGQDRNTGAGTDIKDKEQGGAPLQNKDNNQKPAALTAQSLSGLKVKKRKRPSRHTSPSLLFVDSTAWTQPEKRPKPPQDSTEPKAKDDAETATDGTSDSPAVSQDDDMDDATRTSSGHAPRRPRKKAKTKTVYVSKRVVDMRQKSSEWYESIDTKAKFSRGDKTQLEHVKQLIKNCIDAVKNNGDTEKWFSQLRTKIHDMEGYRWVTPVLVKKSRVLDAEGILQIFDGPDRDLFPWDISADAQSLWGRWMSGDIDGFILRGIVITKTVSDAGKKRTTYSIEDSYPAKISGNVPGKNNLMNGRWWPLRICALRDGAHGAIEAGISGQAGNGAFSIVLSDGKVSDYPNEDHGETILYCGTKSETTAPTADTLLLDKAYLTRQPVRVLRAVNRSSQYAPKEGVRYDGLYEIINKTILDPSIALNRFELRRLPGQDPVRYQGVEVRPTNQELRDRMNIRKDL